LRMRRVATIVVGAFLVHGHSISHSV
jgi:hypothetical protein